MNELPRFWCVYDTETKHKFIKKSDRDGSLGVFDYEYEAIEAQSKNTAVEEVYIITPKKLNKIKADAIREAVEKFSFDNYAQVCDSNELWDYADKLEKGDI